MIKWIRPWVCAQQAHGRPYWCPVCDKVVAGFARLPDFYFEQLDRHQYVHSIFAMETLNILRYQCPECLASDRDRLCALYLRNVFAEFDRSKSHRCLDIAPSPALRSFMRGQPFLRYATADLSAHDVDFRVDIREMSFPDESFDIVLCSHVLEHVEEDRQALRELHRILRHGGVCIVMVPIVLSLPADYEDGSLTSESDRWKHFGQGDHVRLYSRGGFVEKLIKTGFEVVQLGQSSFGAAAFERAGIHPRSVLYVGRK
jgi:SAM-dependent methyltransferase